MKFTSQGKLLIVLLTLPSVLGLAGCNPLKGLTLLCSTNCPPILPAPEFLYATSTNHVLTFTIDESSGALSVPVTAAGPNQSTGMAASMNGQLYVSDFLNDTVDGFSINLSSGALTAITNSPFWLGGIPPGAGGLSAFVQNSNYLYATDLNAGTVAGFLYDSGTGVLTPVPGSPFSAGNTPVHAVLATTFQGNIASLYLYVSNLNDSAGGISAFTVNQQNGALSPILGSPFPTGAPGSYPGPSAMVVSVGSGFLYVALAGTANANNQIAAFSINPATGGLSSLPQSPFTTGNDPLQMAYVPITAGPGGFLYTGNVLDDTISAFTVDNSTGVLTPIGSSFPAGSSVGGLAAMVTATGNNFLYQSDPQDMSVRAYTINLTTGEITPVSGSPFSAGGSAPMLLVSTQ